MAGQGSLPRAENWRGRGDILLSNITFYIQKLIAPLQQTVNPSDRKSDKSFSSLVSLYCSHYLPVVTSKLFFFFQLFNFAIFNYLENLQLPPGH